MPDNSDSELVQAAHKPLVLAIDLIGWELSHPSDRLSLALNEPGVHWKIHDVIRNEANNLVYPAFETNFGVSGEPAKKIALGTLGVMGEATWDSVKKSPRYQLLDQSLKDLKTSFDKTPTGIWVDRHAAELILFGSLVTIGGAIAQYHFRGNDDFGALYAKGVSLATKKIKIGDLTLGADFPTFAPSKRELEFKSFAQYDFKPVEAKFEFGGKVENDKLNHVEGKALVKVPLKSGGLDINLKGSAGASFTRDPLLDVYAPKYNYAVGVDAETKDKRLMMDLMLSGENKDVTVTSGLKYMF